MAEKELDDSGDDRNDGNMVFDLLPDNDGNC
jgi:hypothetical protein